ncbi:Proteasome maturation protein, partial [Operophtera brumata]
SFGLPSLKVKPEHTNNGIQVHEGQFGVADPFAAGLCASKPKLGVTHPIELSERNHDVLSGRHLDIGFEDILNTPELCEVAGRPHAVVERSLGLL